METSWRCRCVENQSEEHNWDIFEAGDVYAGEEGLLDDIRDLRRYLILVENQLVYGDDGPRDLIIDNEKEGE